MVESNKSDLQDIDQARVDWLHKRLNNEIDKWHASDSSETLAQYLGMSNEGYAGFVRDPEDFIRKLLNIQEKKS